MNDNNSSYLDYAQRWGQLLVVAGCLGAMGGMFVDFQSSQAAALGGILAFLGLLMCFWVWELYTGHKIVGVTNELNKNAEKRTSRRTETIGEETIS
jgi:hypothetical protein